MRLPDSFIEKTFNNLKSQDLPTDGFLESFDMPSPKGIRINRNKVEASSYGTVVEAVVEDAGEDGAAVSALSGSDSGSAAPGAGSDSGSDAPAHGAGSDSGSDALVPVSGAKVPWCDSGFYIGSDPVGNDPYYHAGVFYPQEPSAMLPGQIIAAKPGEKILDLCAAPGGKTCRVGEDMKGEGLLVANEINESRAKALLRNVERMGLKSVVVLNETPEHLASKLTSFFDKILLDVPCSGEGMFRRDSKAVGSWEKFGPSSCIPIQKEILEAAHVMLKPGGSIVYSTCTFDAGEDEEQIAAFIGRHPEYKVVPHPEVQGVTHAGEKSILPGSMRIWPHLTNGDGHFCVHLIKDGSASDIEEFRLEKLPSYKQKRSDNYGFAKSREAYENFMKEIVVDYKGIGGEFVLHGNRIHIMPASERIFDGFKAVKLGDYPGEIKPTTTERLFIPSHSLALSLNISQIREDSILCLPRADQRLARYLKGETITVTDAEKQALKKKGHIVIAVDSYPLGFGKISPDGSVKNLYPKAWRIV